MPETFHLRLKAALVERGYSQKEFAKMAGLTEGQLSHYLSGYRMPRSDILERIAKALNLPIEALLPTTYEKGSFENAKNAILSAKGHLSADEKMALMSLLLKDD